jgi:hypothetical protein
LVPTEIKSTRCARCGIRNSIDGTCQAKLELCLCGEMAGDPMCVALLVGLGYHHLSMKGIVAIDRQQILGKIVGADGDKVHALRQMRDQKQKPSPAKPARPNWSCACVVKWRAIRCASRCWWVWVITNVNS